MRRQITRRSGNEVLLNTQKMAIRLYFLLIFVGLLVEINGKAVKEGRLSNRINYLLNVIEAEKNLITS